MSIGRDQNEMNFTTVGTCAPWQKNNMITLPHMNLQTIYFAFLHKVSHDIFLEYFSWNIGIFNWYPLRGWTQNFQVFSRLLRNFLPKFKIFTENFKALIKKTLVSKSIMRIRKYVGYVEYANNKLYMCKRDRGEKNVGRKWDKILFIITSYRYTIKLSTVKAKSEDAYTIFSSFFHSFIHFFKVLKVSFPNSRLFQGFQGLFKVASTMSQGINNDPP